MIASEPLLSIITVCYNAEETIESTIKSVDRQVDRCFEHIIVDGASTDKTLCLIAGHRQDYRSLLSEKDNGIYYAMNKGLKMAKGRYILFLNSGDLFFDENVTKRFHEATIKGNCPGIIYGQTVLIDSEGTVIGPRHLRAPEILNVESFSDGMTVCHQAFFALRELTGPFDVRYRFSADYDWCLKILRRSQRNFYLGDEPIIKYLNEGTTGRNRMKSLRERYVIMAKNYGWLRTTANHARFLFRFLKQKNR